MPRVAGQIDRTKNEAILDAASDVLFERGLAAPLDEIARRAGVSKQTIYNHYGSKAELVRALIARRVEQVTAALEVAGADGGPEIALAAYARRLLATIGMERGLALFRLLIQSAPGAPEMAKAVFETGMRSGRRKLAEYLAREARAGRLGIADPDEAAAFFSGMVVSHRQVQGLLGVPLELTPEHIDHIAAEATRRFLRAYAP
ncbi:MAG TPA: TetR/AcrR family transcriptional regulator [Caulobacteraceae bacterium]|nr:TetR/AcrR family transcriptional regulator [Caulobacteraceae bacterium]